ncbi:MAG: hypothetical protein R2831_03940 [Chitinophagaceae bacterium]
MKIICVIFLSLFIMNCAPKVQKELSEEQGQREQATEQTSNTGTLRPVQKTASAPNPDQAKPLKAVKKPLK